MIQLGAVIVFIIALVMIIIIGVLAIIYNNDNDSKLDNDIY